jgi:hypothetical protein
LTDKPLPATHEQQLRSPWFGTNRGQGTGAGRKRMFEDGEALLNAFDEYAEMIRDDKMLEEKLHFDKDGNSSYASLGRMRAMSLAGFRRFLGVGKTAFEKWMKEREDLQEAFELIRDAMFDQKFSGAAAGLLKEGIVMRDLGMVDRQELSASVGSAAPPPPLVDEEHMAIHVHPDDPDPLDLPRPLYSKAQLKAGIQFTPPKREQLGQEPNQIDFFRTTSSSSFASSKDSTVSNRTP